MESGENRRILSEMTLEELWQLFPITLTQHRAEWAEWYAAEAQRLAGMLPAEIRISHIGSTAIPGIWAKPIIDILAEIPASVPMTAVREMLEQNGYLCMSDAENRMSFNMGYTAEGFAERVFHLHLRYAGDHDELYFRDYMQDNPELAKQYEELKLSLWKPYKHDRDGYTAAKTDFIAEMTAKAKQSYGKKYKSRREGNIDEICSD